MSQQHAILDDAGTQPGDSELVISGPSAVSVDTPTFPDQQMAARRHIQDMALDFVRAMATLSPSQPPQIPLVPRPVTFRVGDLVSDHHEESPLSSIRSLTQTAKVMQLMHDHLPAPVPAPAPTQALLLHQDQESASQSHVMESAAQRPLYVTRRDLYYQDPELFKSQRTVDAIVNSLSHTIRPLSQHSHEPVMGDDLQLSTTKLLDASHLGVVASSRGVALGSCRLHLLPSTSNSSEHNIVDLGTTGSTGILLPPAAQIRRVKLDPEVAWVLIVEKDATFQALAQQDFPRSSSPPGLIVTSRGFPDFATRQFLHLLPDTVQMYTLVDADPFGVHIHWMYQQALTDRTVTHLGVHLEDMIHQHGGQESVMALADADLKRIKFLMGNEEVKLQAGIMRTLQTMLHMRVKAEVQALGSQLLPYLHQRLQARPIQSQRMGTPSSAV
ncbi:Spo11/DNA topoisomerase VI subunit A [Catenaria anguillulae PL171]|uniref:DNA topoisomerase (ATP-hydrolyzing) n=1 Tax=Catenaria anguillulae PL171 TaxID=765915 RepID=A0A1Y2I774_9FUNG|nr:Spo11/DNA topoisomerase VI subunit A [Catenaria anguillulae PL171]